MPDPQLPIELSVEEVQSLMNSDEVFLLLDCREQDEYDFARIPGSTLIPMSELQERVEVLEEHRSSRIVVHCHHGGRSLRVAHWLRNQNFSHAQSMAGGIDEWSQKIDPSVPRY